MSITQDKKLQDSKLNKINGGTGVTDNNYASLPEGYSFIYYIEGSSNKYHFQTTEFCGDHGKGQVFVHNKLDEMYANKTLPQEFISRNIQTVEFQFVEKRNGVVNVYYTFNLYIAYGTKFRI